MPILWLREGGLDHVQYYKRGFQMAHHRLGGRASVGVVLGAVLLAAAGCASGSSTASKAPSGPSASASQPPTSSTAPSGPSGSTASSVPLDQNSPQAQAAIATYHAMWADMVQVELTMNDQDPTLAKHLTGGALFFVQQGIHINKLDGYVAKGEPRLLHPTVKQIVGSGDGAKVLVEDCVDEGPFRLFTSDGTPVSSTPDGRHLSQALVERQSDGSLKVTNFVFNAAGSC